MSWTYALKNPHGIRTLYQGSPPPLNRVLVHEVALNQDGPTLRLRIDLSRYPAQPPQKWVAQGFNTVQVEITFGGVRTITLEGFGTNSVADISLDKNNGINIIAASPEIRLSANAEFAFISQLRAYANDSPRSLMSRR
ncbi:Imm50 family immunity protein [Streptomyces sp. CSDS2]|uniref:Imm50 family immunity protein n=1 Tax=Streptomyces sp. CSDS2 TaxID=3055051 RepID=UPI0025B155D3|nr:Imm50 family immunity protein [Streptomyces sp. CSDS2]MDN3265459.1 Imm50 family immunity protein [Streptomyces sp. CSDS2]